MTVHILQHASSRPWSHATLPPRNIAHRLFLGLSLESPLPHHTSMTYFRHRLGPQRLQPIFDTLVGQARRLGLVKDRLRLKDATHLIANIAVPSTIRLVAQTRDQCCRISTTQRRPTAAWIR